MNSSEGVKCNFPKKKKRNFGKKLVFFKKKLLISSGIAISLIFFKWIVIFVSKKVVIISE